MKYWAILTKLRMPFWQRIDMAIHHLFGGFASGFYAIDWWGYYKFIKEEEPPAHCYIDDQAWTPKERRRLLTYRSSPTSTREDE